MYVSGEQSDGEDSRDSEGGASRAQPVSHIGEILDNARYRVMQNANMFLFGFYKVLTVLRI